MVQYFNHRFGLAALLAFIFVGISFITRTVLLFSATEHADFSITVLLSLYCVGLLYDLIAVSYYIAPFVLYIALMPDKLFMAKIHRYLLTFLVFVQVNALVFNGFSEWFFWDEFGKRFNFIAVDYLVYTKEVVNNILESYPIPLLLTVVFLVSSAIFYLAYKKTEAFQASFEAESSFLKRIQIAGVILLLPIIFFNAFDKQGLSKISDNQFNNELAKNGFYSLFSAFRHNTLDYDEFYKNHDDEKMLAHLKALTGFDGQSLAPIRKQGAEQKYNVMLVMVESLSASYMNTYGDDRGWTPHLDALTKKSLFFDNVYATGTRTVRGMEAVTLSIPPTPGRSIVKRPDNHNLFSSGFIFEERGYDSKFIYAGYGYFDNMNEFYSNNGFEIIDRTNISEEETTFANVWGVCDEDLFDKAIKEADKSFAQNKPFFSHIMTTSNHRPYTYPEGKIDIPSLTGRSGGVKYTDYAINQLLKKAALKPWFNNTIFIIVADHNGASSGKASLPAFRYKIPLIMYAPEILETKTVSKLASQVDVMPTLFSLLNWSYDSMFYGKDILEESFIERAFIGNHQKLGYLKDGMLLSLEPDQSVHQYKIVSQTLSNTIYEEVTPNAQLETDAITYYQSANYMFKHQLNQWPKELQPR